MCQTDHQVVMKKALDDYIPIYSAKIEVNSQPIDHFELLVTDIILQNSGQLGLGDILNATMLDEYLQYFEENCF